MKMDPILLIPELSPVDLQCLSTSTILLSHTYPGLPSIPLDSSSNKADWGNVNSTYYLGNVPSNVLTSVVSHKLRVDMWDTDGRYDYAEFASIRIQDEDDGFALSMGSFTEGSNGDGEFDLLTGTTFKMSDTDTEGCVNQTGAPWWYNSSPPGCAPSQLLPNTDGTAFWGRDAGTIESYTKSLNKVIARIYPTQPGMSQQALSFRFILFENVQYLVH